MFPIVDLPEVNETNADIMAGALTTLLRVIPHLDQATFIAGLFNGLSYALHACINKELGPKTGLDYRRTALLLNIYGALEQMSATLAEWLEQQPKPKQKGPTHGHSKNRS
jgi:hypothetical protein